MFKGVSGPQSVKNVSIEKVPTEWKSNKKASMTSHIMDEWLGTFNAKMKKQKLSVLLFLDSKTCHPHTALLNARPA
jgi:hypothetical protein